MKVCNSHLSITQYHEYFCDLCKLTHIEDIENYPKAEAPGSWYILYELTNVCAKSLNAKSHCRAFVRASRLIHLALSPSRCLGLERVHPTQPLALRLLCLPR